MGIFGTVATGIIVAIIIVVVVVVVIIVSFVSMYNALVKLRNTVEEAFSTMDVFLKKRFDLIPNLVETVKGSAAHERESLEKVILARNMAQSATDIETRMAGEDMITTALRGLLAVSENYPQLRANENFMMLQKQINDVEDDIANSRRYYNGTVRLFNTKTETFPSLIVAGMFRFVKKPLFEVADTAERENIKVQF